MWDHARLLRRTLLISSVLALSGLHVPPARLAAVWRAVRLVPLSLSFIMTALVVGFTFIATSSYEVFSSAMFVLGMAHGLFTLACLQRRGARLHRLLGQLSELEEVTAICRRAGEHRHSHRCAALIGLLTGLTALLWAASFFAGGEFGHPHYLTPMLVPAPLQGGRWYWVLVGMQAAVAIMIFTVRAVFDLVQVCFMDAVAMLLERLGRYARRYMTHSEESDSLTQTKENRAGIQNDPREQLGKIGFTSHSGEQGNQLAASDHPRRYNIAFTVTSEVGPGDAASNHYPAVPPRAPDTLSSAAVLTDPRGDLDSAVAQLSQVHRSVAALAAAASDLCSPMTVTQHASIIMEQLVGLYITIGIFVSGGGGAVQKAAFVLYQAVTALRLVAVSVTGSRLAASAGRLTDSLLGATRPSRTLGAALRFSFQMLIEQTRRPPQFSGGGFFVTQKETMLSVLSFVLTYFIIMVQLNI
ncbi:hypothetical protein FJT64_003698 [Amphibalanus amphitrite]|uniref:Odorant receptor n=1 Tax=Amphibalanus amphitrite TaxID=1232801 RepID=A0A6A4W7R6_AMPAM|nr:hypothetical protein FJT64_003698 [Amphibalanus amphitrite]